MAKKKVTEQRARQVAKDLLQFRGWDLNSAVKNGQTLEENEYKNYKHLDDIFKGKSKSGAGDGYPDFLVVNNAISLAPLIVLETKADSSQFEKSIDEAIHYADSCRQFGHNVIAVGVAGGEKELCKVGVYRFAKNRWKSLTLDGQDIDWIPSPDQLDFILSNKNLTEVKPEIPSSKVLADQANRINQIFRECKIKDEYRPQYIATFMLGLWHGDVDVNPKVVLNQINANSKAAILNAEKPFLSESLRVDAQNSLLANKAWEIIDILKKLNIRSFIQEHDYLGQLYETFFRYTGGNTIGQYFTPRHIIDFICDILKISKGDRILDPACGTGGFLIGAMNRIVRNTNLPYEDIVNVVKDDIYGIESEPATAALCITNMIFRGDGKSGIVKGNCFEMPNYPEVKVDFVLMNPPFPHKKKTDTPTTDFLDRGLNSLNKRGILAAIVPYSLLVRMTDWHKKILKNNTLYFVGTLPSDIFQPYATYDTAILMIRKGVPHGSSKVFMSRISNDGYKVKKKNRIERLGSQLPEIMAAYETRMAIPEVTAFPEISDQSSEWSPENYIEDSPYTDKSFVNGLEIHIKKHASFYILNGEKLLGNIDVNNSINITSSVFSSLSKVDITKTKLVYIKLSDYFEVELGGKDELEDLSEGNFPVVSTSEFMNGVSTWKEPNEFYPVPSITVATDGSVCSSFVQEVPYYAFYKVAILTPKKDVKIPSEAYYYISYLLTRQRWRYVYARKFGKTRINNTEILVPSKKNGKPDWKKMASIIKSTSGFQIIKFFKDNIK